MQSYDEILERLARSKFRNSFKLNVSDVRYVREKGLDVVRSHAYDFVAGRLAPAHPKNDGKQTPMKGHPAFKAMHACACCCRGCLEKWHGIPQGRPLIDDEQAWIVCLLMAWIERQMEACEQLQQPPQAPLFDCL